MKATRVTKKKADVAVTVVEPQSQMLQTSEPTPDGMIAMAVEKNMDITVIERLMKLRNEEIVRLAKKEYLQAMSKFQEIIPDLQKNRNVNYTSKKEGVATTNYNYQDLGSIIKGIKPAMAECGLTHRWEQTEKDNVITVVCIVSHVGGHEQRGEPLSGQPDVSGNKAGLHAKASTITYLQRYTLKGILGLTSTETDDDGYQAVKAESDAMGTDKPSLDGQQVSNAINLVLSGEETLESLQGKWNLTQGQVMAITKAQGSK